MKSKKTKAVATALLTIKGLYLALQHPLQHFLSDSEGNFEGARQLILPTGTTMTHTPPLEHCKRNERFQQRLKELSTATLDLLPYHLPSKYEIHLKQHSIHLHNSVPNTITLTRSPDQIFDGAPRALHPIYPFLPFGAVCNVKSNPLSMQRRATLYNTDVKYISPSEVGVNLGWDDAHPYCNSFLLANGLIIFRKTFIPLDDSVIPFGWLPKSPDYLFPSDTAINTESPTQAHPRTITTQDISTSNSTHAPPLVEDATSFQITTPSDKEIDQLPSSTSETFLPIRVPIPPLPNNSPLDPSWTIVSSKHKRTNNAPIPTDLPPVSDSTRHRSSRRGPLTKALLASEDTALINDCDFFLYPPLIKKEELTYKQAMLHPAAAKCSIALDIELGGLIDNLHALGPKPTAFEEIPPHGAIIPSKAFFKYKPSLPHEWKCRFVLGGDRQPADTFGETFAGMADLCLSILILALAQAHSVVNNYKLHVAGFDITMAFPKVKATPDLVYFINY
jgi:hypothetical protein